MINYAWISKLLRDATFAWGPSSSWLKSDLFRDLFRGIWLSEQFLHEKKVLFWCFWVSREINSRFCSKTQWQMFLLVSGHHVGAHPDGHQHGGSIQISINLGKKFLRISCIRKIAMTWKLGESLCIFTFFLFSESGLYLLNGFDFYFEWRDTENQQFVWRLRVMGSWYNWL